MSDKIAVTGIKGFLKSDIATKLVILLIIIVAAGTFIFSQVVETRKSNETFEEWKKTNDNIAKLLDEMNKKQNSALFLTTKVKTAHKIARTTFDNDLKKVMAETLKNVGMIQFPTALNDAFTRFNTAFDGIKDELIPGNEN
jgi:hypothetical protein